MVNFIRHNKSNGLDYYILQTPFSDNNAFLALIVKSGSLNQKNYESGLAHMVEHACAYFDSILEERFYEKFEAYTEFDHTVYIFKIFNLEDNIVKVLKLIKHIITGDILNYDCLEIIKSDMQKEKDRINEYNNSKKTLIYEHIFGKLFCDLYLPFGNIESILSYDYESIKNYHSKWYSNINYIAVSFIGKLENNRVEEHIKKMSQKLNIATDYKRDKINYKYFTDEPFHLQKYSANSEYINIEIYIVTNTCYYNNIYFNLSLEIIRLLFFEYTIINSLNCKTINIYYDIIANDCSIISINISIYKCIREILIRFLNSFRSNLCVLNNYYSAMDLNKLIEEYKINLRNRFFKVTAEEAFNICINNYLYCIPENKKINIDLIDFTELQSCVYELLSLSIKLTIVESSFFIKGFEII